MLSVHPQQQQQQQQPKLHVSELACMKDAFDCPLEHQQRVDVPVPSTPAPTGMCMWNAFGDFSCQPSGSVQLGEGMGVRDGIHHV